MSWLRCSGGELAPFGINVTLHTARQISRFTRRLQIGFTCWSEPQNRLSSQLQRRTCSSRCDQEHHGHCTRAAQHGCGQRRFQQRASTVLWLPVQASSFVQCSLLLLLLRHSATTQ
jgi:hypothetical protein